MTAVADVLVTFHNLLPSDNFDNAKWIQCQWVEMCLKKCASEVGEVRKKGRRGNKRQVMDLGERTGNIARANLPELPDIAVMVVIHQVPSGTMTRHPAINIKLRTQM